MRAVQINVHFNEPVWMYDGLQESIYNDHSEEEE